jgi:hypothetical protein
VNYSVKQLSSLASALITFGIILIIGAFIAYNYHETYTIPFIETTITTYPYRNYAFLLGIIGIGCIGAGIGAYVEKEKYIK